MSAGRRLARGALAAFAVGALSSACGVPSSTDVRVDGPMPQAGAPEAGSAAAEPPGPDDADNEKELVEYFLQAAAGDPEDPVGRLREFIHSDERDSWRPDPRIVVVRSGDAVPTPGDRVLVEVDVREVGVLTADGVIEPWRGTPRREVTFEVVEERPVTAGEGVGVDVGDPMLRIVDPPEVIMLSAQALEAGYLLPRPVYFWDGAGDTLVPDLRWVPSALAERKRAQRALDWLVEGPAPWLDGALAGLPDDVALDGNVVWSGAELEVGLTAAATDVPAAKLEAQLWWTLRPELSGGRTLVLRIDGQPRTVAGDHRLANPAVRSAPPSSFAVVDGEIRQYGGAEVELPALSEESNAGVHSAALTHDGGHAALVKVQPDGRLRLLVTRPDGQTATQLRDRLRMSRPLWLASDSVGLVAADGELYRFRAGEQRVDQVPVPGTLGGAITALAVAPDGHRLALVAGGRLYVASMTWRDGGRFTVNEPRRVPTTATGLQGVGFLREDWLAVVGDDGNQLRLYEITVDGALERELPLGELGSPAEISNVVASPADPTTSGQPRIVVMWEQDGQAFAYSHASRPQRILPADLVGAAEDAPDPRAPFFLD